MEVRRSAGAVLAGAALILTAYMFDAAPLFVVGVAFALLGVAAPAWVWLSAEGASVERSLEAARVVEGDPLKARLELRGGPLGLPAGEVSDPLAGAPLRLPRGKRATIKITARFERRGVRRFEPPVLRLHDPLELALRRRTVVAPDQEILVLPRTEPVNWTQRGGESAIGAAARARAEMLAAVEVDGLRPYRPGTPASRIHWPALARGAGDTLPLVVLDARGSGPEELLDQAVRAAASLTLALARAGGCRLLLPGDRRAIAVEPDLASWPLAHTRLALVEGGPAVRAPSPTGIRLALGPLLYLTPQSLDRLPSTVGRQAVAGLVVLVMPAALAGSGRGQPSFSVSGCVGYVVGSGRRASAAAGRREAAA
jgi:uncharacterized protein (DUF58 family)